MAFRATSGTTIAETTFANIPSPVGSNGVIIRVSDVGPAPGILLISNNVIWRPLNGRAVLHQDNVGPFTTIQDLTSGGILAWTSPAFPGGLVRVGMRVTVDISALMPGITTSNRVFRQRFGPVGSSSSTFNSANSNSVSGANVITRNIATLEVLSDTNSAHGMTANANNGLTYTENNPRAPSADFSQPWEASITLQSVAETAVNISSASWAADVVTFNTAAAHTLAVGDKPVIASVNPAGYNGTYVVVSAPDTDTFTAALVGDPGAYVSGGTSSRISNVKLYSIALILEG